MKFLNLLTNEKVEVKNTVKVIEDDLSCIISIPHCSPLVPIEYKKNRKWNKKILKDTDLHTDKLFNIDIGVKIIGKCNPYFINYSRPKNPLNDKRGVIAWQFLDGSDILLKEYNKKEIDNILSHYDAFHNTLQEYIKKMIKKYGYAIIIDGHGMAKKPLKGSIAGLSNIERPDICIGTLDGKSMPENINKIITSILDNTKYTYKFNDPYKGGYITKKYSSLKNVYVIQLETVKENYYNNKGKYEINNNFKDFKSVIDKLIKEIVISIKK